MAPPRGPERARVDAVLRSLSAEEARVIHQLLDRWAEAGHPAASVPGLDDLEPDDTGNIFDEESKALIATPEEWAIYSRLLAGLRP